MDDRKRSAAMPSAVWPAVAVALLLLVPAGFAQWSAQPGERVRNAFGVTTHRGVSVCQGACGIRCPSSCRESTAYECVADDRLRRVRIYACGTHEGCRTHDDCLNRCARDRGDGHDCRSECHREAVEAWGLERAVSWAAGSGPYDGDAIVFEYTTDGPDLPEPAYRCPAGASRSCDDGAGRCVAADGSAVEPVFDSYPAARAGGMQVSGFRAGRVCETAGRPSRLCETTQEIEVTGDGAWYGFEFDYAGADPSKPIVCEASGPDEDFLGGMIAGALRALPTGEAASGPGGAAGRGAQAGDMQGLGEALGALQEGLKSGRSLTDVLSDVQVTTADGRTVGGRAAGADASGRGSSAGRTSASGRELPEPGVPREVDIRTPRGHLLVPMYEPLEASSSGTLVREVRCTHDGAPVLETTFRLRFAGGGAGR